MPERPKGADCKSAGVCLRRFESFSPHRRECSSTVEPQPSKLVMSVRSRSLARIATVAHLVECLLDKEDTRQYEACYKPVTMIKSLTSFKTGLLSRIAYVAQSVEHFLGKEEATGSSPVVGSLN